MPISSIPVVDPQQIISMVKLRFPALQNPKLSRQGNKYPCWYFTYQRNGQIKCLNFDGNLSQSLLIVKIDYELTKSGLQQKPAAEPGSDA
jgi:hypothetical protein